MEKIFCGLSGEKELPHTHKISDLPAEGCLKSALISFYGADVSLRPAQEDAVFGSDILSARANVILATPTNSGKSLLAYMLAFKEAFKGKRGIIIEPLRALAQEKVEELKLLSQLVARHDGPEVKVSITTGDYRLHGEFIADRPRHDKNSAGEIVVATPERLDAISRVREYREWFSDVSLVCIDEAHLLGDSHRGAALELLITFLRTLSYTPQVVLLSATISNPTELSQWLEPCMIVGNMPRYPQLEKWLYGLEDKDEISDTLVSEVKSILEDNSASVLIFVYQTKWAESLAYSLASAMIDRRVKKGDLKEVMGAGAAWYHAGMSSGSRMAVRQELLEGNVRVVVSTTALAMGINLPTTHVIVRDITYPGVRNLDLGELSQMIGRAGRGDVRGVGIIYHRPSDKISFGELESGLKEDIYPKINSQLIPPEREGYYGKKEDNLYYIDRVGSQLLGILNRMGPISPRNLEEFLMLSWGGQKFLGQLEDLLYRLRQWKLAFFDEGTQEYGLTRLGQTAARCHLPTILSANIGQLVRDLLQDAPDGGHLNQMSPIDLLIILCLTSTELRPIARYSKPLETKVASYMEGLPLSEKSYLYRQWIAGDAAALMGSARVDISLKDTDARKLAYRRAHLAMFVYDLSKGIPPRDMQSRYRVNVEELEERIRDTALWLLFGLEEIFEVRSFYYHLKEICEVSPEETKQADRAFKRLSRQAFGLLPNLRFRSSLGQLVRGIKRVYPNAKRYPGEGTIRRLEEGGIANLGDLIGKSVDDLIALGAERRYAELIAGYVQRRRV